MALFSFVLSMPSNNAWNGRWSGQDDFHVVVREMKKSPDAYYSYDFGDGWVAGISVEEVSSREAKRLRKQSQGFCGYNWMIDSIIDHGKIQVRSTV